MFIICFEREPGDASYYFAARKKDLPGLVEEISKKEEEPTLFVLVHCTYMEINTKKTRSGEIDTFDMLQHLLKVKVVLNKEEPPPKEVESD